MDEMNSNYHAKNFTFDEEVIAGYTISKERKQVWNCELEMLKQFDKVCKKNNISYIAFGGTMLGAIRHKGFIPWDDDIDLAMLRSEYDKLCAVAQDEFQGPLFFQTTYNDTVFRGHAQLRNSKTTGILQTELKCKYDFNQGIFLDIFPLDEYPVSNYKFKKQRLKVKIYKRCLCNYFNAEHNSIKSRILNVLVRRLFKSIDKARSFYSSYEQLCGEYNGEGNGIVGALSVNYGKTVDYMSKEALMDLVNVDFMDTVIPVPRRYDEILKQHFGDYMKFSKEPSTHGDTFFSADISYKEFIQKIENGELKEHFFLL